MKKVVAKAPINIALIKYWGKINKEKVIPYNSSISMTLDNLYTITSIEESSDGFSFSLNDVIQSDMEKIKIINFLLHFTTLDEINKIKVVSTNYTPTAAGLASSSSGYSALAVCANSYFKTNFDIKKLATITRLGSGSACRSLFDGFVGWDKDGEVSQIDSSFKDFVLISVIIKKDKKDISSRDAMDITVKTSPYFNTWVDEANSDYLKMRKALNNGDINQIGILTEKSARLMHASMLAANPSILYIKDKSMDVWKLVQELRKNNVYCYATMDAGPNVKILTTEDDYKKVLNELTNQGFNNYYVSRLGTKACLIYE